MKKIILFLIYINLVNLSFAQLTDADSLQILAESYTNIFDSDDCYSPNVKTASIVEFESSMSLFVKFSFLNDEYVILKQDDENNPSTSYSIHNGELVIDDLQKKPCFFIIFHE